ncbi:FG-GAP-like repeat-containing protein [Pseudochryseolinea flava]|uniref:PKD domain-containing protein n=1 Tax=Pseudochryseolinea flava TaxID=2059302 RepID=A0A364Y5G0_9BACT|nr:FG-GAP-like repeat-containing protein [Pseudochryseolinea flava]RAW01418.1 hypothetical protein DQQ10_10985 [Pseudochryseolinea flava]
MKKYRNILLYVLLILAAFAMAPGSALAQKPEIVAVDKVSGPMEDIITLKGSNFGSVIGDVEVHFGAQKGVVKTVTDQLLEVAVPPGSTHDNISVTHIPNKLTGYSSPQFLLSFSGVSPFDVTRLGPQQDFNAADGLYDHCLCDLNTDGRVDIAAANRANTNISILQNTSTGVGSINFSKSEENVNFATLQIKCGDLNGDGRPDLVATEGTTAVSDTRIFILQNNGAMNFTHQEIKLTGQLAGKIEIADLDRDGKPEIIVTDQKVNPGGGKIVILKNISNGPIVMESPVTLTVNESVSADAIAIKDLNGDHFPDIAVSQFGSSTNAIHISVNKSTPGNISFDPFTKLAIPDVVFEMKIADVDNDRKPDVIVSRVLTGQIAVYLNTTATVGGAISIVKKADLPVQTGVWGFDVGDVDGDGLVDIVSSSTTNTKISISSNQSSAGNVSFTTVEKSVTFITREMRVGDLDGDGKPEISFCSVDKPGTPASKVSILRNKSCVLPKINPERTPIAICANLLPYKLTATASKGSYYQWLKNGVQVSCGLNQYTFDVTAGTGTGVYSVKILAEGSTCASTPATGCSLESNQVDITVGAASAATFTAVADPNPLCEGGKLTLKASPTSATKYSWTGPDGFAKEGATVELDNFELKNAGTYEVFITVGTCVATRKTVVVKASSFPTFTVGYPGSNNLCEGDPAKTLTVFPSTGFNYQWKKDGANIADTDASHDVTSVSSQSGSYTVKVTSASCVGKEVETAPVVINVVKPPVAAITAPASACEGQEVSFTTTNNVGDPDYEWTFGDSQTASIQNPTHIYNNSNAGYTVTLKVSFAGACPAADTHTIEITDAPTMTISTTAPDYKICSGETITLTIANTFVDPVWSNGDTGFSTTVGDDGIFKVTAKAANGCVLTAQSTPIVKIPAANIILTAEPAKINEGETSQLNADGLLDYTWTPSETLTASNIPNPVAQPIKTTEYTVSGLDQNGCIGTATITLTVFGEAIVNKLGPKNFFSPNNSGPNDVWLVENITDFPQCAVTIYDDKGVKVFDAKPYANDWDGKFNGKDLPDGVYFYVIRCEGEENSPRTGSITLIR